MSKELRPRWNGVVLVDEKMCPVRGKGQWFYLAVDTTGDIMHCRPVPELSSTEAAKFLEEVRTLGVHLKAVVSDLDPALTRAIAVVYAETPHQYCIKHALSAIGILIGNAERNTRRGWNGHSEIDQEVAGQPAHDAERAALRDGALLEVRKSHRVARAEESSMAALHEMCRRILSAQTEREARILYDALQNDTCYPRVQHRKAVRFLKRRWKQLMMHHHIPDLPRTTNLVENVNKQLQRRYKTIEAFQYRSTAIHYTNLLVAFLRQKPYTDCRGSRKHLNGKSRLASAKIRGLYPDWLKNCLKGS